VVRKEKRRSVPIHSASYKGLGGIACGPDVRFGSKADICSAERHVRLPPKADIADVDSIR
jgi:hypothetical protein